jgi:RHS repeat-associated protein
VATDSGGVQTYHLYDGLGSTVNLTDAGGSTTATYSYDVFGAIRSQSGGGSNQWLFTGEQRDSDSGLYYLRARYYDPAIGRFLGLDPLGIGNGYSYVSNNPVNYVDPYGLIDLTPQFVDDIADCVGDPVDCGEAVASNDLGFAVICNVAGCVVAGLLNPETRNFTLNAIQWLDIVPVGVVPGYGTVAGAILDLAAFMAAEYQIVANQCVSSGQKVYLTGNNAFNLIIGEIGNLVEGVPGLEWTAVPFSAAELSSFEAGQAALNCSVAYSSGGASKE